jgi:LysM repeat protein
MGWQQIPVGIAIDLMFEMIIGDMKYYQLQALRGESLPTDAAKILERYAPTASIVLKFPDYGDRLTFTRMMLTEDILKMMTPEERLVVALGIYQDVIEYDTGLGLVPCMHIAGLAFVFAYSWYFYHKADFMKEVRRICMDDDILRSDEWTLGMSQQMYKAYQEHLETYGTSPTRMSQIKGWPEWIWKHWEATGSAYGKGLVDMIWLIMGGGYAYGDGPPPWESDIENPPKPEDEEKSVPGGESNTDVPPPDDDLEDGSKEEPPAKEEEKPKVEEKPKSEEKEQTPPEDDLEDGSVDTADTIPWETIHYKDESAVGSNVKIKMPNGTIHEGHVYRPKSGDSLTKIARKEYDNPASWRKINNHPLNAHIGKGKAGYEAYGAGTKGIQLTKQYQQGVINPEKGSGYNFPDLWIEKL